MAKKSYLFVVPSTCQMYSGTGTAIFDWIRFAKDEFDFTLTMDCLDYRNYRHTVDFCTENSIEFIPSKSVEWPFCPDVPVKACAQLLATRQFDVVESVSWANAATNSLLLSSLPSRSVFVYTPHAQPLWTIGQSANVLAVKSVFKRVVDRADIVLIDSAPELKLDLFDSCRTDNIVEIPLGVDITRFCDRGAVRTKTVLSVCDFREKRKRADLLIDAAAALFKLDADVSMVLAGRGSKELILPDYVAERTKRLGYISADELLHQYGSVSVYALMSDYEAFGLPIAEALCSGTPVVINRQPVTASLFSNLPGVKIVDNVNIPEVAKTLFATVNEVCDHRLIMNESSAKFGMDATYGRKLKLISDTLKRRVR